MDRDGTQTRGRRVTGNILMFLPGLAVILSETMKFARVPAVVRQMASAGFPGNKLILVATLGFLSAVLFLYPRTRSIGLVLLSSFLGGAICLHVQKDQYGPALVPSMLLTLAWVGTWLRHPLSLRSLSSDRTAASHLVQDERRERMASKTA